MILNRFLIRLLFGEAGFFLLIFHLKKQPGPALILFRKTDTMVYRNSEKYKFQEMCA